MAVFTKWKGVFKSTQKFIDSVKLYFGNDNDAYIDFDGTNFRAYPLTDTTGKVAAGKIASGVVVEGMIGTGAVTAGKIGSGAVTSTKLGLLAVIEAYIGAGAVVVAKLGAEAVETAKIKDANVTTAKIADAAVTSVKQSVSRTIKSANSILTPAEAGAIIVNADNVYVQVPTYVGNAGLRYTVKAVYTYSSGVTLQTTSGTIDGASTKRTQAQYAVLDVIAGASEWHIVGEKGTSV